MEIDIEEVEEQLASHPQQVINSLRRYYCQTRIVVSVITTDGGPFCGQLVGITDDSISVLVNGDGEEPVTIPRDEIREVGHDFERVGRPAGL